MRITKIVSDEDENNHVEFDNGKILSTFHYQDCCELNYADFSQLDDIALSTDFDEPLEFEAISGFGFRFGNRPQKMFFVPCYSEQNGYYSDWIDICYDGDTVVGFECDEVIYD